MKAFLMSKNAGIMTAVGLFGWLSGSFYEKYKIKVKNSPLDLPTSTTPNNVIVTKKDQMEKLKFVQNRTMEIMRYGFPSLENVISYDDFILSFDRRLRIANWVFEHMNRERLKYNKDIDRSLCDFKEDNSIHPYFRASNKDYKGSGFDRGHLAAASNHRLSQDHLQQTFQLTNIAPQVGVGFNRDSWNRLEKYVRNLVKDYENIYVCTGPLFLPYRDPVDGKTYVKYQVLGESHVAVPTHFFKVVLLETKNHQLELEAFVMPNKAVADNTPLSSFQVPLDVIERNSGLLFSNKLSKDKLMKVNGKKASHFLNF